MSSLARCESCGGLVPAASCPNCLAPRRSVGSILKSFLLGVGGASLASMTLMACYGMPPCDPESMSADAGEDPYDRCYDFAEDGGEDGGELLEGDAGVDGGI